MGRMGVGSVRGRVRNFPPLVGQEVLEQNKPKDARTYFCSYRTDHGASGAQAHMCLCMSSELSCPWTFLSVSIRECGGVQS